MSSLTPVQKTLVDRIKKVGQAEGLVEAAAMAQTVSGSLQACGEEQAAAAMADFSLALGEEAKKRGALAIEGIGDAAGS